MGSWAFWAYTQNSTGKKCIELKIHVNNQS